MKASIQELAEEYLITFNEKDFNLLYIRIKKGIYNKCYEILKDEDDAKEVFSRVLEKLLKKFHQYDSNKGEFSTWIYNIAINECFMMKRRAKKTSPFIFEDTHEHTYSNIDDSGIDPIWEFDEKPTIPENIYDLILEKINTLPEKYRDIIIDRDIYLMKYDDIAIKYAKPRKTIATLIRRGRLLIKSQFPDIKY